MRNLNIAGLFSGKACCLFQQPRSWTFNWLVENYSAGAPFTHTGMWLLGPLRTRQVLMICLYCLILTRQGPASPVRQGFVTTHRTWTSHLLCSLTQLYPSIVKQEASEIHILKSPRSPEQCRWEILKRWEVRIGRWELVWPDLACWITRSQVWELKAMMKWC